MNSNVLVPAANGSNVATENLVLNQALPEQELEMNLLTPCALSFVGGGSMQIVDW